MNVRLHLALRTSLCVVFVLLAGSCLAAAEKRVALVIGNAAYAQAPLRNPVNDASDIAEKLRGRGFDVVLRTNLKTSQIGRTLREFRSKLTPGAVALVFYAGHGLQVKGENYLPTVDADIEGEEDIPNQSLAVRQLLDSLDEAKTSLNLVFLDACRNNPFSRRFRSAADGLARTAAPSGTLISFATRPGSVAADGEGRNGIYTEYLLQAMDIPNQPVEQVLKRVASGVKVATKGRQEPWMEGGIEGDFYFLTRAEPMVAPAPVPSAADATRAAADANRVAEATRAAATDKAVQDALRAANEQAAKERAELKASMERIVAEALERQRRELEAATARRDAQTPPRVAPSANAAPAQAPGPSGRPATTAPTQLALNHTAAVLPSPAAANPPSAAELAGIGDEWEYIAKDLRFNHTHTFRQRVTAMVPGKGALEEFFWDGKAAGSWAFDGRVGLVNAPTEAGFILAPRWTDEQLTDLNFLGASRCSMSSIICTVQIKRVGRETITVPAGTFDAIKIDGQILLNSQTGFTAHGTATFWLNATNHRLLKQYGKVLSGNLSRFHFEETLELAAIRRATQ